MHDMGRNRKRRNASLPPNLYENGSGYYTYRHPRTGKKYGMGGDRQAAIVAARHLNSELAPLPDLAERILDRPARETFADFLDWFEAEQLPTLDLSKDSFAEYRRKLPYIRASLGDIEVDAITVANVANFLDKFPPTQSNHYRSILVILFKQAIARGLCERNPAEMTLKRKQQRQRARLSLEQFNAIREYAPAWLKNAMDLGLKTLQRRGDLAALKWEQVHDGYIWIQQQKVERYGSGNLKIRITSEIENILIRCRDEIESHYVIHRVPERRVKAEGRNDPTAVLPDMISKAFLKARVASGLFDESDEARTLPSFHEIRSFGADLYKQAGIPTEKIQALLGHTSIKMTEDYLKGHRVRWSEIDL